MRVVRKGVLLSPGDPRPTSRLRAHFWPNIPLDFVRWPRVDATPAPHRRALVKSPDPSFWVARAPCETPQAMPVPLTPHLKLPLKTGGSCEGPSNSHRGPWTSGKFCEKCKIPCEVLSKQFDHPQSSASQLKGLSQEQGRCQNQGPPPFWASREGLASSPTHRSGNCP